MLTRIDNSNKLKNKITPGRIVMCLVGVILSLYTISMVIPLIWTFYNSFKSEIDYTLDIFGLPDKWLFSNWLTVWKQLNVEVLVDWNIVRFGPATMIFYTLIIAITSNIKNLFGNMQIAYILAKFKSRFTNFLWAYMIVMMFIPLGPSLVVSLKFAKWLGYWDNLWFYCLWGWGSFGGNTLLLYGSFKGIPDAYGEAAKIDGAGPFRIFFSIYVPQIFPMLATLFILSMMGCWSDYMTTVIWLPSFPTLGYGLYYFRESASLKGISQPIVLAAYLITALLSMILYLSTQNLILTRMTVGTLKQ